MLKRLSVAFLHVFITLLMLEGLLRLADPLGGVYYIDNVRIVSQFKYDDALLYILPSGTYRQRNWTATQTTQGRIVPETRVSDCVIVAVGDSVTFGQGVNDAETWVNLLAYQFRNVQFINAGLPDYNSKHVLRSIQYYTHADGFVYLISANDLLAKEGLQQANDRYIDYIPYTILSLVYVKNILTGGNIRDEIGNADAFLEDVEQVKRTGNVIMFIYQEAMREVLPDVPFVDYGDHRVSVADSHPDARGHREIAEQMKSYVAALISEVCPS